VKVVSIHQPGYLPWLGYLHKILYSDLFILHDQVEYSKRVFIARVLIRKPESPTESIYLTVPLRKHSDFIQIKDLLVDTSQKWQTKHLNLIQAAYRKAPHFEAYFPVIEKSLLDTRGVESFVDVAHLTLKAFLKLFNYDKEFPLSSRLPVSGKKSEYNVNLVRHFQGTVYLSGSFGKEYQSDEEFIQHGISVVYQDIFEYLAANPYPVFYGEFINGLASIDALFNVGVDGIKNILEKYQSHQIKLQQKV
jgi:hypothetical protein